MRKIDMGELKPTIIKLLNACPKCGGELKALILVGRGACQPQKQLCTMYCGFEKSLIKEAHA